MDTQVELTKKIDIIHSWYQEWCHQNDRHEREWSKIGDFKIRTIYRSDRFRSSKLLVEICFVGSGSRFFGGDPVVRLPEKTRMDELLERQRKHSLYLVENEFRIA